MAACQTALTGSVTSSRASHTGSREVVLLASGGGSTSMGTQGKGLQSSTRPCKQYS